MINLEELEQNNLIEIKNDDTFIIDMMYAREDNILGYNVYSESGMGNHCIVHKDVWKLLQKVAPVLKQHNLKMKICDAYRHPQAHLDCIKQIPMDGFFAKEPSRSQHCRAAAIDIILTDNNGVELKFPCKVDAYEKKFVKQLKDGNTEEFFEHLKKASYNFSEPGYEEEIKNRDFMKQIMSNAGFFPLIHEWWHFNLQPREETPKYPVVELSLQKSSK